MTRRLSAPSSQDQDKSGKMATCSRESAAGKTEDNESFPKVTPRERREQEGERKMTQSSSEINNTNRIRQGKIRDS